MLVSDVKEANYFKLEFDNAKIRLLVFEKKKKNLKSKYYCKCKHYKILYK